MAATAPDVGRFKRESALQLALHRQIHGNGIGRLEAAINPIGVEGKSGRIRVVRRSCRVADAGIGRRKNIDGHARPSQVTRRIIGRKNVGRCRLRAVKTERAELAEAVYDSLTEVVVVHADAGTDGGLAWASDEAFPEAFLRTRRIGYRKAGGEIAFVHRPVRFSPAALARRNEGKFWLIAETLFCCDRRFSNHWCRSTVGATCWPSTS